jgi:hypothetical protein
MFIFLKLKFFKLNDLIFNIFIKNKISFDKRYLRFLKINSVFYMLYTLTSLGLKS